MKKAGGLLKPVDVKKRKSFSASLAVRPVKLAEESKSGPISY
jgi:hypothetical protein